MLSQFGAGDRQASSCHRPTAIDIGSAAPAQAQSLDDLQAAAVLSVRARPRGHQLAVRLRVEDLHIQQRVLAAHGAYLRWGYQIMGRIKHAPESPVYDAMLLRPA
ncbi:hypothetical protein ACFYO6_12460 [Streptomyces anthocyanicus]|uniref:hypothetical protein n=1 Tax=Streptomyces TaxID=1883 RepID=UPI0036324226